jgi:hypothetical protein
VNYHLSRGTHGAIDHVVLTQRVNDGEPLATSVARFKAKWQRIYKVIRAAGMKSALVTYHVKRTRSVGWHYHAHVVVEWSEGVDAEVACVAVANAWQAVCAKAGERTHPTFYRHVSAPGDALTELATDGQGEFWKESSDPVTQVLQYAVRDVCQGVEKWVEGVDTPALSEEFAEVCSGAKLHRLYGGWRAAIDEGSEDETEKSDEKATEAEKAKKAATAEVKWLKLGSMDSVLGQAARGVTMMVEFVHTLECSYFNRAAVFRRLSAVARSIGV